MRIRIGKQELVMVGINAAKLRDVVALQTQTGLKMQEILDRTEQVDAYGLIYTAFLSLHNAGQFVSLAEIEATYSLSDIDPVPDAIDNLDSEVAAEDPTPALTASAQGDASEPERIANSRRSPAKTGSKPRSTPAS